MIRKLCILPIQLYQICISPYIGKKCRFLPTCSDYAIEAINMHGVLKGAWLAVRRILKCHPFHPGGVDEVPKS